MATDDPEGHDGQPNTSPRDELDRVVPGPLGSTGDEGLGDDAQPEPSIQRPSLTDAATLMGVAPKPLSPKDAVEVSAKEDARLRRKAREAADAPLRSKIANWSIGLMIGQIIVDDAVFVGYCFGTDWHPATAAISAWSGASVAEIIGIVLVITRYLFPRDGGE